MARTPSKTCPSLYHLFDNGQAEQIVEFLRQDEFQRQSWLEHYTVRLEQHDARAILMDMLHSEKKDWLTPLEREASRVLRVTERRGQFVLDGLAQSKLKPADLDTFKENKDELARSLWTYLQQRILFEAVESALHLRLYRQYGKHYQAFPVDSDRSTTPVEGAAERLVSDVEARLDQGKGCSVECFDVPADGDEPASEMFIIYHPNPFTSAREIREDGERHTIYFRPPGEATVVHTPGSGIVQVRADTRILRRLVAESFAGSVLDQKLSSRPLDARDYDLSRFFSGFQLECPDVDGFALRSAQVIKAEVSIGNLRNRLSLSTMIGDDIDDVLDAAPGLCAAFRRASAIRFIEIAVRYVPSGESDERTLDFTISDQNSCSLLSLPDERERILGHRLLRHWGVLRELRPVSVEERGRILPVLLELWDLGLETVSGSWLQSRGLDAALLTETGFLEPAGWEHDDLIDEDDLGLADARVTAEENRAHLQVSPGQEVAAGNAERYRNFRIRQRWLVEHLQGSIADTLDEAYVEALSADLYVLGELDVDGSPVPVYLTRRTWHERVLADTGRHLRERSDRGIGLVLNASAGPYKCLAANVLTPLADHLRHDGDGLRLVTDTIRAAYRNNRHLARGGQSVEFVWDGGETGELFIPGTGTIQIPGHNRLVVMDRLVNAYKSGSPAQKTGALNHDLGGVALSNIFGNRLWERINGVFVRSAGYGYWELAV